MSRKGRKKEKQGKRGHPQFTFLATPLWEQLSVTCSVTVCTTLRYVVGACPSVVGGPDVFCRCDWPHLLPPPPLQFSFIYLRPSLSRHPSRCPSVQIKQSLTIGSEWMDDGLSDWPPPETDGCGVATIWMYGGGGRTGGLVGIFSTWGKATGE